MSFSYTPFLALALFTLPALMIPAAAAAEGSDAGTLLVGYDAGNGDAAIAAVKEAGGAVLKEDEALGLLVVESSDLGALTAALDLVPSIAFVDSNGPTALMGADWNGADWNGADWNGADWNGESTGTAPDGTLEEQWGLRAVRAADAWSTTTGSRGANVCVLDSGVQWDHPDLAANMWTGPNGAKGYNAIDGSSNAYDDAGHGTHVAGIAAAVVDNDEGVAGVGNTRVMAAKVLDSSGQGTEGDLAFGISWCARSGADIAVMALGVSDPGPALDRALAFAERNDVVLLASTGNAGCDDCVGYPARDARVIAVAATTPKDARAPFSNGGAEVEVAAPGTEILGPTTNSGYTYGTGTSQAVAFAAGAAALARDAHPDWSASATRDALASSARDVGPAGRDAGTGHGIVDVAATLG